MYSSVLFSVRERKSPAESFLKFKQNVEFPTGAVRAKSGVLLMIQEGVLPSLKRSGE